MAVGVKELWKLLDISDDKFIRTTDDYHEKGCSWCLERLLAQDDIYLGEIFRLVLCIWWKTFTESQLAEVFVMKISNWVELKIALAMKWSGYQKSLTSCALASTKTAW